MITQWQAEAIRLTAIGQEVGGSGPLFERLIGVKPNEQLTRPALSQLTETGEAHGYRLTLAQFAGRVDAVLADDPRANTVDPGQPGYKPFFSIGDYEKASQAAQSLASRLITCLGSDAMTAVVRLAFAPILLRNFDTVIEAQEALSGYLPNIKFDPRVDTDIFWQINRPRTVAEARINRLSKWHVVAFRSVGVMAPGFGTNATVITKPEEKAAVRVELDLNFSPASVKPQTVEAAAKLFVGLADMAREIATQGDIP